MWHRISTCVKCLTNVQKGETLYGAITDLTALKANLESNCLPDDLQAYVAENYDQFLEKRRKKMAEKIKHYYQAL